VTTIVTKQDSYSNQDSCEVRIMKHIQALLLHCEQI